MSNRKWTQDDWTWFWCFLTLILALVTQALARAESP